MKKQKKIKLPRNWVAVHAHFRKAGSMGDDKKQKSKEECRKWKSQKDI